MRLTFLTANIALGLPRMSNGFVNLLGHLIFHGLGLILLFTQPAELLSRKPSNSVIRNRFFERFSDVAPVERLISRVSTDVVALNEVLTPIHTDAVNRMLRLRGYRSTSWGFATHHPGAVVSTVVASRLQGTPIPIDVPMAAHPGGGGGVAALRIDEAGITVVAVHLCLQRRFPILFAAQIAAVKRFSEQEQAVGRSVVLMGDWNASSKFTGLRSLCSELRLVPVDLDMPTCPTYFSVRDSIDHILCPNTWRSDPPRSLSFGSDHLAVTATVETKPVADV